MKVKIHGKFFNGDIAEKTILFYREFYESIHSNNIDRAIKLINDYLSNTGKYKKIREIRKFRNDLAKLKRLLSLSKKFSVLRIRVKEIIKTNLPPPETMISE